MNWERFKTLLLIALIMVSVYLANQIWLDIPNTFFSSNDRNLENTSNRYSISDIVLPERILVNFSTWNTVFYSDKEYNFWDMGRVILARAFQDDIISNEIIDDDEFNKYKNQMSLDYYFPEGLRVSLLSRIVKCDIPNFILHKIDNVSNIHIDLGSNPFIVLSNGEEHLKILPRDLEVNEIRIALNNVTEDRYTKFASMENHLGINSAEYVPINMKYDMPSVEVNKEKETDINNKSIDSVVEKLFNKDLSFIDRYEEKNGTELYSYNQQVLRIYSNGKLDYVNAFKKPIGSSELYKSLTTAINFISDHVGWPEDSYLKSIEDIEWKENKGYRFKFSYKIHGAQVMLDKNDYDLEEPIEIEVFNDEVKSYRRYLRVYKEDIEDKEDNGDNGDNEGNEDIKVSTISGEMPSVWDIINTNLEYIRKKYIEYKELETIPTSKEEEEKLDNEILQSINKIYLGYYLDNDSPTRESGKEILQPKWIIEIDGMKLLFDINGEAQNN